MGSSTSKNVIDQTVRLVSNIINQAIVKSSTTGIAVNFCGSDNCKAPDCKKEPCIRIYCDQRIVQQLKATAINEANFRSKTQQEFDDQLKQFAKAVVDNLGGIAISDAQNINDLVLKLGNQIYNQALTQCTSTLIAKNAVKCSYSTGDIYIIANQSIIQNAIQDCCSKIVADSQIAQDLKVLIDQTSIAKEQNVLFSFMIVIIIIIAGAGIIFLGGGGEVLGNPSIWIAVIAAVIIYYVAAYYFKLYPFNLGTGFLKILPSVNQ